MFPAHLEEGTQFSKIKKFLEYLLPRARVFHGRLAQNMNHAIDVYNSNLMTHFLHNDQQF